MYGNSPDLPVYDEMRELCDLYTELYDYQP